MITPERIFRGVLYLWLVTLACGAEKYYGFHYQMLNTNRLISGTPIDLYLEPRLLTASLSSDVALSSILSCRCLIDPVNLLHENQNCFTCYIRFFHLTSLCATTIFFAETQKLKFYLFLSSLPGISPGVSDGKETACKAEDVGLIPGLGRFPGEGNGNPLQYSCLENSMNRRAWWATVYEITKSRTWLSD